MLKQLSIANYALIEQMEVDFEQGLSIITGETGAGKSILLGALGLILGDRADNATLRDQEKKCVIEGLFQITDYGLDTFFKENELDYEPLTTLRREVIPGGKSRAFINDTPVTLNILKELGELLIDIHTQHQTRLLNSFTFQVNLVDAYSGNKELILDYKNLFLRFSQLKSRKKQLEDDLAKAELNHSFLQFQFDELHQASLLSSTELEEMEQELAVLSHAELIKQALKQVAELLSHSETNANSAVLNAKNALLKAGTYYTGASELAGRLESVYIELKDVANEAENLDNKLILDEERLAYINQRVEQLTHLLSKHRFTELGDLITFRGDIERQLNTIAVGGEELESISQALILQQNELSEKAKVISSKRLEASSLVTEKVNQLLGFLGMPHAELRIDITELDELRITGNNEVSFLLKSNLGGGFQALDKVASGGELSRIMLCLKAVNAEKIIMPTIIFDEIDTGVSGEIASKMGQVLKNLGKNMQVISISHLPQIAGHGRAHYKVSKQVRGNTTVSTITKLNSEERILEIAGMISGSHITEAAMQNARALLQE